MPEPAPVTRAPLFSRSFAMTFSFLVTNVHPPAIPRPQEARAVRPGAPADAPFVGGSIGNRGATISKSRVASFAGRWNAARMIRYGGVVAVLVGLVGCGPAQTKPEVDPCVGVVRSE